MIEEYNLWLIIVIMGLCSFGLRFVFLGLVGDRALPPWMLRHLRYTAVAVIPALVAPLAVWPPATDGTPDPLRLTAAILALMAGFITKNIYAAMGTGAAVMIIGPWAVSTF